MFEISAAGINTRVIRASPVWQERRTSWSKRMIFFCERVRVEWIPSFSLKFLQFISFYFISSHFNFLLLSTHFCFSRNGYRSTKAQGPGPSADAFKHLGHSDQSAPRSCLLDGERRVTVQNSSPGLSFRKCVNPQL